MAFVVVDGVLGDLERYMLGNGLKSVREYTILSNGNVSIDEIETSADNNAQGRCGLLYTRLGQRDGQYRRTHAGFGRFDRGAVRSGLRSGSGIACLPRACLTASTYAAQPSLQRKSQSNAK